MQSSQFSIKKQYISYSNIKWNGNKLHEFQTLFLNDSLDEFNIITAPTGAGKTFGFGLLLASENSKPFLERSKKILVIAPTIILCQQIKHDISLMYEDNIEVGILNSERLNQLGNKGIERWYDILDIVRKSQVIIATPDIINFIITSGYQPGDFTKTTNSFIEFITKFSHIVIDEFHLYSPEQISNIMVWQDIYKIHKTTKKKAKLLFVSATPTDFLEEYFNNSSVNFNRIKVPITDNPQNSRVIHGELSVEILAYPDLKTISIFDVTKSEKILEKWDIKNGKLLCIYNSLRALHYDYVEFQRISQYKTLEVSGFNKTYKSDSEIINSSDIILATSALEQGVNIKVKNALMFGGFTAQSLIQRFGRVSRGDYEGNIMILMEQNKANKIKELGETCDVNTFYSEIYKVYGNKNGSSYDSLLINKFKGAFWYVIISRQKNYDIRKKLKEIVYENSDKETLTVFKNLYGLEKSLENIKDRRNYEVKKELKSFFNNFIETFRYFREKSVENISVFDKSLDLRTEYTYDWVLKNKEIVGEEEDGTLVVVNKTEENPIGLKYSVISLPMHTNDVDEGVILDKYKLETNPKNTFIEYLNQYSYEIDIKNRDKRCKDNLSGIISRFMSLIDIVNSKRFLINKVYINDNVSNSII